MAVRIDETLYRALYDETIRLVAGMVPSLTQHALQSNKDPAAAVGDAMETVFRRVLESYEKLSDFTEEPRKRPASLRPKPRIPFA